MKRFPNIPSLSLLNSFEAAARHQSYTLAAEELGVTQGAVSRQVRELENFIGFSLFHRIGRTVRLTDAGRAFAAEIVSDLDRLQTTVNRTIAGGAGATLLTIAVLPTFAARWLVPRLPDFKRLRPGVEIELQSRTVPFALAHSPVDLAIHYGRADWPEARLVPLCPEDLVVVASPELVSMFKLTCDTNFLQAPLLHLTSRPDLWARYSSQLGISGRDAFPGPRFDQFSMLIAGAIAGLGVAILPTYLIERELASGDLQQVGQVAPSPDEGYFMVTPVGKSSELTRAFCDWLKRQVRQSRCEPHDELWSP